MSIESSIGTSGIAEIRLAAPERRNALGFEVLARLAVTIAEAERDGAAAVLLCSAGPVFSAGADFNDLTGTAADLQFDEAVSRVTATMRGSRLPVVVAVQGPCLGAAVDLALAGDVVIAARSARFVVPATRLGILYNPTAIEALHRQFPAPILRQLLLGVPIEAEQAVRGGLIARVVADDDLLPAARAMAEQIAGGQVDAVAATKGLLAALDAGAVDPDLWAERRRRLLDSEARREAVARARAPKSSRTFPTDDTLTR